MSDTTTGDRPAPLLARDAWRNVISLGVTTVVTITLFIIYNLVIGHIEFTLHVVVLVGFVFWTCYSLVYLVLTVGTFTRADPTELASWLGATMTRRALQRGESSLRGAGPSLFSFQELTRFNHTGYQKPGRLDARLLKSEQKRLVSEPPRGPTG